MKPLTLIQLRKSIRNLKPLASKDAKLGLSLSQLESAELYMLGTINIEPPDPRRILKTLGFKW